MPERYLVGRKFLDNEKWYEGLFNSSFKVYLLLFFIASFVIISYCYINYYNDEFYVNIWVEAHGMLFDLALFGIIYTWLNNKSEKRKAIKDEVYAIDDLRHWKEPEASLRIVGNIKRLNNLGITVIKLNDCYLKSSNLNEVDLSGADLIGTNLQNSTMHFSVLRGADLREADLRGVSFYRTDFKGAKYNYHTKIDEDFNYELHQMVNTDEE